MFLDPTRWTLDPKKIPYILESKPQALILTNPSPYAGCLEEEISVEVECLGPEYCRVGRLFVQGLFSILHRFKSFCLQGVLEVC